MKAAMYADLSVQQQLAILQQVYSCGNRLDGDNGDGECVENVDDEVKQRHRRGDRQQRRHEYIIAGVVARQSDN